MVTVHIFGLFLFLGFLLASFVVWKQARSFGLAEEKVLDTLFAGVFLSLIVGRLGYVFLHWGNFSGDYARIVLFLKYPGLSLPILLTGMIAFSGLLAVKFSLEVLWLWDILAVGAASFAVFGYLGYFLDTGVNLSPVFSALALAVFFLFLARKISSSPTLAQLTHKRGLFFLCYLIFQFVSLLMTTRLVIYGALLILTAGVVVARYRDLLRYVYRAISQRRSGPD